MTTLIQDQKLAKAFKALDSDELLDRVASALEGCNSSEGALWAVHYNKGGVYFFIQEGPDTKQLCAECVSAETLTSLFGEDFEFGDDSDETMPHAEVIVEWMNAQI